MITWLTAIDIEKFKPWQRSRGSQPVVVGLLQPLTPSGAWVGIASRAESCTLKLRLIQSGWL